MRVEEQERAALLPAAKNLVAAWQQTLDDTTWFGHDEHGQAERAQREDDCALAASIVADLELDPPWTLTAQPAELRWLFDHMRRRASASLSRPTGSREPLTGTAAEDHQDRAAATMTLSVVCGDLLARLDELDQQRNAEYFDQP